MKSIRSTVAVAAAVCGVAVVLAGPASADPLSGAYTATATEGGLGMDTGTVSAWTFSPCGADCTHLHTGGGIETDLHLQDNVWTGADNKGCFGSLDNGSLVYTVVCPDGRIVFQLRKGGA
jgi:hypothetical protein